MCVQVLQNSVFSVLSQVRIIGSIKSMKDPSDPIENGTSVLLAFTRVPQQSEPPRATHYKAQT